MPPRRTATNAGVHSDDRHVSTYVHLAHLPRASEALIQLKKIASAVKPIMRNHKWKVGELAEFYPNDENLLGLNVDRGRQICLRLRHAGDKTQFLPPEMVLDTMLHELCHIVHGPHNESFHDLWEKLRDEHMALTMSGYTGESFLSDGRRLGGAVPSRELGRLSRQPVVGTAIAAAGRRLGGTAPATRQDMRNAAAAAAERRRRALEGCGAEKLNDAQISSIGATASQNGFRTKAEEDKANDIAIAKALAELVEMDDGRAAAQAQSLPASTRASSSSVPRGGRPVRRIPSNHKQPAIRSCLLKEDENRSGWVCSTCTLYNPAQFLCCDACGAQRAGETAKAAASQKKATVIDLT